MSHHEHRKSKRPVNCMIITISDTRSDSTDKSGNLMVDLLKEAGHHIVAKKIIPDEQDVIQETIDQGCEDEAIDVILTNGGTGISYRDVTYENVEKMLDKELLGFGEIFRMLRYDEDIGSEAIMSLANAGVRNHTAIITPLGSSGAVDLDMKRLIIPELTHVVNEINKEMHTM